MASKLSRGEAWKRWSGPINTEDDAAWVIREASKNFLILAAIQAALSYFVGWSILIDAVLFAVLALWLMRYKSRTAACVLLGIGILDAVQTFRNRFAGPGQKPGGTNVILAVIVVWVGVRAVQATFKYRQFRHALTATESP